MNNKFDTGIIVTLEDRIEELKAVLTLISNHLVEDESNEYINSLSVRPVFTMEWLFLDIGYCISTARFVLDQIDKLGYHCNRKDGSED